MRRLFDYLIIYEKINSLLKLIVSLLLHLLIHNITIGNFYFKTGARVLDVYSIRLSKVSSYFFCLTLFVMSYLIFQTWTYKDSMGNHVSDKCKYTLLVKTMSALSD